MQPRAQPPKEVHQLAGERGIDPLPVAEHAGSPHASQRFDQFVSESPLDSLIGLYQTFNRIGIQTLARVVAENGKDLNFRGMGRGQNVRIQVGLDASGLSADRQHIDADMRELGTVLRQRLQAAAVPSEKHCSANAGLLWIGYADSLPLVRGLGEFHPRLLVAIPATRRIVERSELDFHGSQRVWHSDIRLHPESADENHQ